MGREPRKAKRLSAEDRAWIEAHPLDRFPQYSVAVDVALLTVQEGALRVLLVRRAEPPERGRWALPGSFVHQDETLEDTARRVLSSKAPVRDVWVEQLYTFGEVQRDPRGRVFSVAYHALVPPAKLKPWNEDVRLARIVVPWEGEDGGPVRAVDEAGEEIELAFDHDDILGLTVKRLRGKLRYVSIGHRVLPERFTLAELRRVHEAVRGAPINKDSFRRTILGTGDLEPTGELQADVKHRPAELYRFVGKQRR